MICADLQVSESITDSNQEKNEPVLDYVISQLTSHKKEPVSTSQFGGQMRMFGAPLPISFRLCMANVLISACQKISDSGKKRLAKKALPHLISSVEVFWFTNKYMLIASGSNLEVALCPVSFLKLRVQ